MKRFAILAAVVALIGCTQNDEGLDNITSTPEKSQTEFYASMPECDTRTYVEDNKYLRWNADDEITVFAGNSYNGHWQFAGEDGANSGKFNEINEGDFVTGSPLDLTANYAIYPYDENITITEAGVVSLTLPAVQEYNHTYANSFGTGANTMMAVTKNTSDNFLSFKNLCGYLKLKLYGNDVTVKSITVKGNNGEKIAGPATVSMAYGSEPTITMGDDATDTITVDCGEGVALSNDAANPTTFWVVIPEITFEGGITIEVTDINDQTFSKQTTNAVPIENNFIQPMALLAVEYEETIPNNEIWYTSSDGNIITPNATDVFGANIISNTIEDGRGVILFDADVTSLGDFAFSSCHNLTSITLPNSIITLGYSPFLECENIKEFNGKYAADEGRCLIKDNAIIAYANASGTEYTIPNGVEVIAARSFWKNENLTNVIIPDSIISIEEGAFHYCTNLKSLSIPNSVTTIGASAFGWCLDLENITLPKGIKEISSGLFNQCEKLTDVTMPDSVVTIQYSAFMNCKSLTNIIIPDNVSEIKRDAFYGCKSLLSITIPDSVMTIGDQAFEFCDSLKIVDIGSNVSSLGNWVFRSCLDIERFTGKYAADGGRCLIKNNEIIAYANASGNEYTIPNNVVTIAWDSFYRCNNLTNITIPDSVTTIGSGAFANCTGLTSVIIPNKVTAIEEYAFDGCSNLKTITIGESVKTIGIKPFYNCPLEIIYCKPITPPTVDTSTFWGTPSNMVIYVPNVSVSTYKATNVWKSETIIGYNF